MILYVRSEDGSIQQVEVTKDLVINPASGQQFYFDDNHGDYKLSLANDDQDVNLAIDVNGTIVNIYFSDMVPLLNNSDSALAIAKNENGTQEIQDNLQNQTFSGQEILDALNAAFEENNIALVQDFGSLTNELDAAAAGGENNSDSVNFITDAKIDTFDENSLAQRDRLEVENEEVGFIDSNGVPTEETSVEADTEVSNTTTVTLGDATVNEDATTASVEVTLEGHDFKDGETVTVTLTNGDTVDFTSNGTQSATINVTADSDSIVETDATSAITASVASDAGTIENPVVNDGELTVIYSGETPIADDVYTSSNQITDTIPNGFPSVDNIAFFKTIAIGGGLDGDLSIVENDVDDPADLGGSDKETVENNLIFDITSLPTYGTVYIEKDGVFTEVTVDNLASDSTLLDTSDNVYWLATHEQIPTNGESKMIGGFNEDGTLKSWNNGEITLVGRDENNQNADITYNNKDGIGVDGQTGGPDNQLGYDAQTQKSEKIIVDFDEPVTNATISITHLIENEGEVATVEAFLDGESVGTFTFSKDPDSNADFILNDTDIGVGNSGTNNSGVFSIEGLAFDQLQFGAQEYVNQEGVSDSSDYFIAQIEYQTIPDTEFTYTVIDEKGNVSDPAIVKIDVASDTEIPNVNSDPDTTDDVIETPEDTAYALKADDFGTYSDNDSTQLSAVKITSLPDNGTLQFNNVAITVPLVVSLADIEAGKLTFNPSLHTDDDSSFKFQVSDGNSYSDEYTTTVNVTAVADAPTASIEIGDPTSTNNDTTKIVHVKAEVNEQLGDEVGDSNITGTNGYNYTEFAVENIDFGPAFANKVVELEMDVTINGSWNNDGIGNYHDDNWTVFVNGVQEALFKYTGQNTATVSSEGTDGGVKEYNFGTVGTSNANINNFNHKPVIQIQLDDEGKAEIKFSASTTETAEHVNINGIIVAENVEIVDNPDYNIYPVDIAAALVDTDGSEILSVQITDIPTGAILQDANGVNIEIVNGVAQIDVNGANSIEEGLTLIVPDSITDFDLNIVARATEARDNEDGQNYKEATDSDSVIAVDTDPDTTDDAISTLEDTPYTITVDDFGTYSDDNSTQFSEVKITSLPDNGTLQFNNVAVTVPLVISLAEIEAGKLTFNPSLHTDDDSSFNFQVSDGETYSDEHTTTVNVTAVADAPTASIEISEIQSVTIDTSNVADTSNGYSVKAYSADGSETTVSTITGTNHDGFGVSGSTHGGANQGASKEIGYDYNSSASEKLAVSFENDVASIDVSFAWKHGYTYNGIDGETAVIEFYKDGVLIESQSHNGGTDTVDGPYTFETSNGEVFDEVRFASLGQGDDYLINAISYEEAIVIDNEVVENMQQYDVDISAVLADTDGSETLTVTITGVPDDAVLISDIYTLVDNGDNTWTVTVPAGETSISDSLKLAVPEGVTNIELDIVARATEARDNEDGTNYEEATDSDEIEIIIDAKPTSVSESQTINFADNSTGSVQEKNIVIILDNSGSMTNHDGTITLDDGTITLDDGTVTTRLALAKESLENLIDTYDDLSNVNVNLTTFGTEASYSGWMSAENAINTINNISSGAQGRSTNYEDALFETYDNYTTPSNGEKATVYFISDGTPTKENSDWNGTGGYAQGIQGNAVDNGYITKWTAFLSDNVEELNVIGIGTGLSVNDPDFQRVAQEVGTVRTNVMVVEDETELKEKLIETIYKEVSGNVLDNVSGGDGDISIDSITVDGHSYDGNDATNNILTLQTSAGGSLTLNFQTGDYTYGGAQSDFVETNEQFTIMVSDTDGDSTNFDVNINIEMNSQSVEDLDTWDVDDYLSNWEDINLGDIANLENYGTIELAGKYGNTLNIDINDVLDNDLDDDAPDLIIKGNGWDDVTLTDSDTSDNTGWEKVDGKETIGDEQFSVYQGTGDASNIKVYIEDDLTIDDDDI